MVFVNNFHEIRIENTNSCGYKCIMCPRDRQTRPLGFMNMEDFILVLDKIKPFSGSIHLHGFGEPLLDRHLTAKVQELKKRIPASSCLIISTLGVRVKEGFFMDLAKAGLDYITISMYGFTRKSYQKIHGVDQLSRVKENLEQLSIAMKSFPIHAAIKVSPNGEEQSSFCKWAQDLGFEIGIWPYMHNFGDGRTFNPPRPDVLCPVINGHRRHILQITWDLDVIPCCYDYNATIRFGNLRDHTLEEIFSSPEYLNFYRAHQTGSLAAYSVCQNCEKIDSL